MSLTSSLEQKHLLMAYLTELKKWNRAYNLTSLNTDEDIIVNHFLDSLLYLKAIPEGHMSIADVGSGAGFPGIPIKIFRAESGMYLLEPSRKKAFFLRHIVKMLGLYGVEVIEKRVEDIGYLGVDVALTRALFSIKEFIRKVSRLVRDDGRMVLSKGPRVYEELGEIGKENLFYEVCYTNLPVTGAARYLVVVYKSVPVSIMQTRSHSASTDPCFTRSIICINAECRLRRDGCKGFEGCPGFKARG
jgi:16S rRNA (guanine527-N7)-methyltransferase